MAACCVPRTGIEPVTSGLKGQRSYQQNLTRLGSDSGTRTRMISGCSRAPNQFGHVALILYRHTYVFKSFLKEVCSSLKLPYQNITRLTEKLANTSSAGYISRTATMVVVYASRFLTPTQIAQTSLILQHTIPVTLTQAILRPESVPTNLISVILDPLILMISVARSTV